MTSLDYLQGRYWRDDRPTVNWGDYVTEILLNDLGYRFARFPDARAANAGECLFVIGSLFDHFWFDRAASAQLVVWGSGYWGDPQFPTERASAARVCAVRGPLTRRSLGLPPSTPMGDPALLLPTYHPRTPRPGAKVLYAPHWHNRRRRTLTNRMRSIGADEFFDVECRRDEWWDRLEQMLGAGLVLTNSLHTAIIAHAYRVPWALCLAAGDTLNKPLKWDDWFESLGTHRRGVATASEGRQWWKEHGSTSVPGSEELLASFPYPRRAR